MLKHCTASHPMVAPAPLWKRMDGWKNIYKYSQVLSDEVDLLCVQVHVFLCLCVSVKKTSEECLSLRL